MSAGALLDEVGLTAAAVVPNVQRREAGEGADGAVGPVVVGNLDPEGGPAVAGVAVVELDGLRVVGDGGHDAAGKVLACGVAGVVGEDLLAGEDPQRAVG